MALLVCSLRRERFLILILFYYFLHDHDTQAAVLTHRKALWILVFCIILSWFGAHDDDDHKQHAAWKRENGDGGGSLINCRV